MPDPVHCSVVTPERPVVETEATYVELPAHDGQIGVMHNRTPLLVKLGLGLLRFELADGGEQRYFVDGGFAQMQNNRLTLLCDRAVAAGHIDTEQARRVRDQASGVMPTSDEQFEQRQHDLEAARRMLAIAGD